MAGPEASTHTQERGTLLAVVLGSSIVFLDSTLVSVALPRMTAELGSGPFGVLEAQAYVYQGYLLTLSALLILGGALSDRYGRRRLFAIGLAGFGVTSLLCGLATTMPMLIAFRLLQGASGAILVPGSLALVASTFTGERRGWAYGVWAAASAATTILGPLVGGVLVDAVTWRMAFLVNAPLVALALWATYRHVAESRDPDGAGRFDWPGSLLAIVALGGLTFGAIRGQEAQWQDPSAFLALGVGAVATLLFVPVEARRRDPLVPLGLFRERNFAVVNVSTLLIYGALYTVAYLTTIHLQGSLGYSATAAGLALMPMSALLALLSSRFGALAGRHGPRRYMAAGPALMGVSVLWLARLPATSARWDLAPGDTATWLPPASYLVDILPAVLLFGLGLAVMVAPLTTALMGSVPLRNAGIGSAINNAVSRIGPQIAGALVFIAVSAAFTSALHARGVSERRMHGLAPLNAPPVDADPALAAAVRAASADGYHQAMLLGAGLLLAGAAVNAAGIRDAELRGAGGDQPAASG